MLQTALIIVAFGINIVALSLTRGRLTRESVRKSAALRLERDKFEALLSITGAMIVGLTTNGRVLLVNNKGCETLGRSRAEVLGLDWFSSFVSTRTRDAVRAGFSAFVGGLERNSHTEYCIIDAEGVEHSVVWTRTLLRDDTGEVIGVLGSGEIIAEYAGVGDRLRLESFLLDNASDSILIHDHSGAILYANAAACSLRGLTREKLLSRTFSEFMEPRDSGLNIMLDDLNGQGSVVYEVEHHLPNGDTLVLEMHSRLIIYEGRSAILSIGRDITERQRAESLVHHLAYYDGLTGLANRTLFIDRLEIASRFAKRTSEKMAVLFLDIDDFKSVNDAYGHLVGDQLLRQIARRLESCVRESDTVSRFGGDEFAVLLNGPKSETDTERVAYDILKALNLPFHIGECEVETSASVGVALCRGDLPIDALIAQADGAMYNAKGAGRGAVRFYCFDPTEADIELVSISDGQEQIEFEQTKLEGSPL